MTCERAQQLLLEERSPASEGREEADRESRDARRHVEACPACREAAEDLSRIGEALRDFDRDAAPAEGWPAFADRLSESVHGAGVARRWAGDPAHHQRRGRTTLRLAVLAAAACLVAGGVAGFWAGRAGGPAARPATASYRPTAAEVAVGAAAFGEVAELFGDQTSWVLLSEQASGVGVEPAELPAAAAPSDRLLILRLTALEGNVAVSDADLVIVPGRTAKLVVPVKHGHELRYHITTSGDRPTRLSLWAELATSSGAEALAVVGTTLTLNPGGDSVSAGRFAASAGPYDLRVAFADAPRQPGRSPAAPEGPP